MDHPRIQGAHRINPLAFQQVGQRGFEPEQFGQAHHAAASGKQAQGDFGQAELYRAMVAGEAVIAGQRQFEAAAEGRAVDRRDHRHGQLFQAAQLALDRADAGHKVLNAIGGDRDEIMQIAAGKKHVLGRGDQHPRQARLRFQLIDNDAEVAAKLLVHRVDRAAHIHRYSHDGVGVFVVVHAHVRSPVRESFGRQCRADLAVKPCA